jgi:hypothetical protein
MIVEQTEAQCDAQDARRHVGGFREQGRQSLPRPESATRRTPPPLDRLSGCAQKC